MSTDSNQDMGSRRDANEYIVLILGKSGNGKSSVANAILGERRFQVGRGMTATTRTAQQESIARMGRNWRVVDTADITNLKLTQKQKEEEVAKWRSLTKPFPKAVLLTVRCDVRYTKEEYDIYRQIINIWGDNSLHARLVVVFTFADRQDAPIEEELKSVCQELKSVLANARHRYVLFSNKETDSEELVNYLMHIPEAGPSRTYISNRTSQRLMKGLCVMAGVSGLVFAATLTANKHDLAAAFGALFAAAVVGVIFIKMRNKTAD